VICVRLMGGLGNQMFQYAAGRALAIRHKTVLKLDLSFLQGSQEGYTPRQFMIDKLRISAKIASRSEIPTVGEGKKTIIGLVKNRYLRLLKKQCGNVLYEFDNKINSSFFSAPDNTYLVGYWQSARYFMNISDVIRNEFMPILEPDSSNKNIADLIRNRNSISIHIRRGDYVRDPIINSVHGVCEIGYFQQCIERLLEEVEAPHFFIFSDEPEWARDHLDVSAPLTIVDHNTPEKPIEDLHLMSLCKHNIIANSSFSWWGAWLNRNPNKIVFAPSKWFSRQDSAIEDILPSSWTRI